MTTRLHLAESLAADRILTDVSARFRPHGRVAGSLGVIAIVTAALVTIDGQSTARAPLRIDAIVTDSQGRAITNLRAADFEVIEDGVSRPVRSAEFRHVPRHNPAPLLPLRTLEDEARAAREPGTRVFAFFMDEFHVAAGPSADRARRAVREFVESQVYERDLALVIRPLDDVRSLRFTRDRAFIHGALTGFSGRKGDHTPKTAFEEQHIGRDAVAARDARRQLVTSSLRELARRLAAMDAERATVVIVSEGFPGAAPSGDRPSDLEVLVRVASQFHVAIYTFNPTLPEEAAQASADRAQAEATLHYLSAHGGGLAIRASHYIAGFASVYHDTEGYWALTYDAAHVGGTFHPFEVRVKRKAHALRARAGYWSTSPGTWTALASEPPAIRPHVERPLRQSPMVDVWTGATRDSSGARRMTVVWEPRRGGFQPPHAALVKARVEGGPVLFEDRLSAVSAAPRPDQRAQFDVPEGRVLIDMTFVAADGTVLDTEARDRDVAEPRFSPSIVRSASKREADLASTNADAIPSATRAFRQSDHLLLRVAMSRADDFGTRVMAELLNRTGARMRILDVTPGSPVGTTQFALPLASLPADDYQIKLTGAAGTTPVVEHFSIR